MSRKSEYDKLVSELSSLRESKVTICKCIKICVVLLICISLLLIVASIGMGDNWSVVAITITSIILYTASVVACKIYANACEEKIDLLIDKIGKLEVS